MSSSFSQRPLAQTTGHADLLAGMQAPQPCGCSGDINGHHADTDPAHPAYAKPVSGSPASGQPAMDMAEWDMMFDAVLARLIRTVGQRLGELPDTPQHSAELSASLVQAVVLECVAEMDKLHTALKQERSQRLTP